MVIMLTYLASNHGADLMVKPSSLKEFHKTSGTMKGGGMGTLKVVGEYGVGRGLSTQPQDPETTGIHLFPQMQDTLEEYLPLDW